MFLSQTFPEWIFLDFSGGESPFHQDNSTQIGPDCIVGVWCIHRDLFCVYCVQAIWQTHSSLKQVQSEFSHNGESECHEDISRQIGSALIQMALVFPSVQIDI
jgi:hypothetical protein